MAISKPAIKLIILLLEKTIELDQDVYEEMKDVCRIYNDLAFPALMIEIEKVNPAFAGELDCRLDNQGGK